MHRGMLFNNTNMKSFRNRKWMGMENNVKKNKTDTERQIPHLSLTGGN